MRIQALGVVAALFLAAVGFSSSAAAQSGLVGKAIRLDPITLSAGKPLAEKPYELEAGKYYRLTIKADGSQELAIEGPEFFRNVWVNEIVVNDIEIRPMGVSSLEFDAEGEAVISFVTILPGTFYLKIPNTTGETQRAIFKVKG